MAALTKGRNTPRREGGIVEAPVLGDTKCFAGGLAVLDASGFARPGHVATTLLAAGRFESEFDNTGGANGAIAARIMAGVFLWNNSAGGDEIAAAEIGDACFIVDDQTVAKTDGSSARSKAGIVVAVDAQGVWVDTNITHFA